MSEKRQPVELQKGALKALLRQPDLPPDLTAKILERTAAGPGAIARQKRRWPMLLMMITVFTVAAVLAFVLLPDAHDVQPEQAVAPESADVLPTPNLRLPNASDTQIANTSNVAALTNQAVAAPSALPAAPPVAPVALAPVAIVPPTAKVSPTKLPTSKATQPPKSAVTVKPTVPNATPAPKIVPAKTSAPAMPTAQKAVPTVTASPLSPPNALVNPVVKGAQSPPITPPAAPDSSAPPPP